MSRGSVFGLVGLAVVLVITVGAAVILVLDLGSNGDDEDPSSDVAIESNGDVEPEDGDDSSTSEATEDDTEPAPTATPEPEMTAEPRTITGRVTDEGSGEPLAGVTVEVTGEDGATTAATTGEDGHYELTDVPPGTTITFTLDGYHTFEDTLDERDEIDIALQSSVFTGTVVNASGEPIYDATVASGEALTFTEEDGSFQIDNIPDEGEIVFKAPGYAARVIPVGEVESEVALEEKSIRGIYATVNTVSDNDRLTELLDMIERTELNSIVIDIKDSAGIVFYDTAVQQPHEIGAVVPYYDVEYVLQEIKSRGIYAIARIVIFEDPVLAEARPEWAIQDSQEGGVWRTFTGIGWMNPYREEVWDYNIALMEEAVGLGFDEIQLDYMRFPTDGPLNRADYGQESTAETRDQAIADFLSRAYEVVAPTPAYLAGDIYGMTLWDPTEGGIGQNLVTVTEYLDYVHPMIYPSHFYEGSMGFDVPNDHPYEVILQSLENGAQFLPERLVPKIRPWLQDFSYGVGIEYGDNEVREQIRATEDFGTSGWLLWNAAASYHEGALGPAE